MAPPEILTYVVAPHPERMLLAVSHTREGDAHVFMSRDVPGLFVASDDFAAAERDTLKAIRYLLRHNHKIEGEASWSDAAPVETQDAEECAVLFTVRHRLHA